MLNHRCVAKVLDEIIQFYFILLFYYFLSILVLSTITSNLLSTVSVGVFFLMRLHLKSIHIPTSLPFYAIFSFIDFSLTNDFFQFDNND
uniref:Uncharacterized protein n=1 Tax=Lactuca sativa TaxID=4236 RepID=A0A9R1X881_LACSA|nr:hypothetical protein LSAT_V11C600318400 [Lactuca sativa]